MAKSAFTNPILLLATALAGGALVLGLWSWQQWVKTTSVNHQSTTKVATVLPAPRPLPAIVLTDHTGNEQDIRNLTDGWSLWFFGFTHCPDVCPNTLGLLAAVRQSLAAHQTALNVVFVSVDPNRDTPKKLAEYVRYFDPEFTGLTGSTRAIDTLTAALYLPYTIDSADSSGQYNVEHSGALVLVDPNGNARAYFTAPHNRENLVHDLKQLLPASICAALSVDEAWIREAPPNAPVMAGYMKLKNHGAGEVVIDAAASDSHGRIEFHETINEDGTMKMRELSRLQIPGEQTLALEPGGMHMMLFDSNRDLRVSDKVTLSLQCGDNSSVKTEFVVRRAETANEHTHHHH